MEAAGLDRNTLLFQSMTNGPLSTLSTNLANLYLDTLNLPSSQPNAGQQAGPSAQASADPTYRAPDSVLPSSEGYIAIDAVARDGDGVALLAQLRALGLKGGAAIDNLAGGLLPVSAIGSLLDLPNVQFVQDTLPSPNIGRVTTQADVAQIDDIARSSGNVDGTGIRVGILSTSFDANTKASDRYIDNRQSNDLPNDPNIILPGGDLPSTDANATDEGRAMAQIIHDIAPGAELRFATAASGLTAFAQHIRDLTAAGARILVDDISDLNEPMYQDSVVSRAVTAAVNAGVTYFTSAGNQARQGYERTFISGSSFTYNGTSYTSHRFGSGSTVSDDLVKIQLGGRVNVELQWDQPYASASTNGVGAQSDLDLFLTDSSGNVLKYNNGVAITSTNNNINGNPSELITVDNGSGDAYIRVGYKNGVGSAGKPSRLRIIVNGIDLSTGSNRTSNISTNPFGAYANSNDGTVYGHHAAEGAIAVGAAYYQKTPNFGTSPPVLEPSSSVGTSSIVFDDSGNRLVTQQVRSSPAFTAVDGGNTTFFGVDDSDDDTFPNFFGTSAAAPGAAATAALMLQARNDLTPSDIRNLLQTSAIDMDDPGTAGFDTGYDRATGSGLIRANEAVAYARSLTFIVDQQHVNLRGTHLNDLFAVFSNSTHTINGDGGVNTVDYSFFGSGVSVYLPNQYAAHGGVTDTLLNIQNVVGGSGGDFFQVDGQVNVITGRGGADTFVGSADALGGDTITDFSRDGTIIVTGVQFASTVDGQAASSSLALPNGQILHLTGLAPSSGTFRAVNTSTEFGPQTTITMVAAATTATTGNDNVVGTAGADRISLLTGNDTYTGGAGNDLVYGNQGNDLVYGNQNSDTVYGGQDADRVYGGQGNDVIYGNLGEDVIYGNLGEDVLYGGQGNDRLYGGQGNDTLYGNLGDDTLFGNLGADVFSFGQNSGRDVVTGFSQASGDRLALNGQTYTLTQAANGDALLNLSGGGVVDLAGIAPGQVNASYFA